MTGRTGVSDLHGAKPARSGGLGASFAVQRPRPVATGSALQRRLDGLTEAVDVARGRLDDDLIDDVEASIARSVARLQLSSAHTVVAIAGSTGSGKSSTFNALVGSEVSHAGAQRPTTSLPTSVVWGADTADDLLDWLEVVPEKRHSFTGENPLPGRPRMPDGLVLLDLPDHDSLQAAHHAEAERMVELADLLVWVVDPQKYADAAIHRRFLQPLAGHRAVTIVVLNHIDTVPEDQRPAIMRDLKKVLRADGIRDPRILATSARDGIGIDELRTAITRRVDEKRSITERVEADVRAAAGRLAQASGERKTDVADVWTTDLERRVADAAGVPALASRVGGVARDQALRQASWPFSRRSTAPARAELRLGPLDRPAVDTAVRALVDNVCRGIEGPWADPVRRAATARLAATDDRLEAELTALRFTGGTPPGLGFLAPARALLAVVGVLSLLAVTWSPRAGVVTALAVVLLVLSMPAARVLADRAAAGESTAVVGTCQRAIARVIRAQVVDPIQTALVDHTRFWRGLSRAVE